jgi:hypothetical protein
MNPVQTVTLQTAILQQVQEFANHLTVFSVHDITVAIRKKTTSGELEIPEVEVQGASFRFDIPHAKVKALFDELYRTGVFDPNYRLLRAFNGMYFEYTPQQLTPAPSTTPASTTPVQSPVSAGFAMGGTTSPAPSPASTPSFTPATNPYLTISPNDAMRVQLYLSNCAKKNFRPILKGVQSAIKRNDIPCSCSCSELKSYISTLGYKIVDDPEAVSKSQVIV